MIYFNNYCTNFVTQPEYQYLIEILTKYMQYHKIIHVDAYAI